MRVAIYSRFSTDKQTESGIADQVRVCTEYAEKQGWSIAHRFDSYFASLQGQVRIEGGLWKSLRIKDIRIR